MEIDLELPSLEIRNNDGGDDEIDGIMGDGVKLNVSSDSRGRVESYMPQNGMEFETKEGAYFFYREYARSVGFGITIKASRRSKKSGKFIDIKIACSRFGSRPQSGTSVSQRPCAKTDCKASMHVKKRSEGKWFVYNFVEGHNHEISPSDFYNTVRGKKNKEGDASCERRGLQLVLDERDVELLMDYFMRMQAEAPGFYYVLDFDAEARMRNVFWVDQKGRNDYASFGDVVFFDAHYIRNKYRIPFVPIVGVNNHFQFILLGCALIGDETKSSFTWLMRTWLRSVAAHGPKVVITDNDRSFAEAAHDVFPNAFHCFCPWHVFTKVGQNLSGEFDESALILMEFKKCTYRSGTSEEFNKMWHKMVKQFDLADDKWVQSLYDDRRKWVPTYMRGVFLGGFCTVERSQSVGSFFDKYLQKETTFQEFIDQYKLFLHEWCEQEVKAEAETRSSGPILICHSPFEKQMSKIYTNAIFRKFQAEVSGILSCTPEKEGEDGETVVYKVHDLERKQTFTVSWNRGIYGIHCLCRLFEYSGYLCRHALSVLQLSGISTIPSNSILKRWTQAAKIIDIPHQASANTNLRVHRLNDICKLSTRLSEEGSISEDAYNVAHHALEEAMEHCARLNYSVKSIMETTKTAAHGLLDIGQNNDKSATTSKIKVPKKRKVRAAEPETWPTGMEESGHDVEQMNQRSHRLHDSYMSQQDFHGMEPGLRIPIVNSYSIAEHGGQGPGHLSSPSSLQDCYYSDQSLMQGVLGNFSARSSLNAAQQSLHAMLQGHFSFRPPSLEGCSQLRDSLHNEHTMPKHLHD
ncbi:protein FAR1-RELATED SEQUENCE 2-like isoform X1 [Salvia hispanica]|uniref:protein FAR1-RELATED SEQUENCE 2-like isoform X1 n=1 Tax=Salvia hispanica TaxID=49212 RepID=UPI00200960CA|nr:protein FAR1-RELATED SEQUENCE 2-like isoform X1 [Salvia hispanica]XP_047950746.1 protein FAR1-RELATED SEQUENCE 2-like isoform X1 [Salvia hispanica]